MASGTDAIVEVVIPWRDHPSRRRALGYVMDWWHRHGFPVNRVDVPGDPFNLAACRNLGVAQSQADVVVIADADTVPQIRPLLEAVELAADGHGTVLPYTRYLSLQAQGSRQAWRGTPLERCHHWEVPGACSGIFVTTRQGWARHHGQDEQFAGWGCEDAAWLITHGTLIGAPRRVEGSVFAFTHDSQDKDGEPTRSNFGRIWLYEQAAGDPARVAALARGEA